MRLPQTWGVTAEEMAAAYHCDKVLPEPGAVWFRAVTVKAPRTVVFRWLCQMKVAPYSYDLLDNLGRRSPRRLSRTGQRDGNATVRITGVPLQVVVWAGVDEAEPFLG